MKRSAACRTNRPPTPPTAPALSHQPAKPLVHCPRLVALFRPVKRVDHVKPRSCPWPDDCFCLCQAHNTVIHAPRPRYPWAPTNKSHPARVIFGSNSCDDFRFSSSFLLPPWPPTLAVPRRPLTIHPMVMPQRPKAILARCSTPVRPPNAPKAAIGTAKNAARIRASSCPTFVTIKTPVRNEIGSRRGLRAPS